MKEMFDISNYNMMLNNIVTNLNYFERLNKEKTLSNNNSNAGYVSIVQLVVGLAIIMGFSVLIGYLLFVITQ